MATTRGRGRGPPGGRRASRRARVPTRYFAASSSITARPSARCSAATARHVRPRWRALTALPPPITRAPRRCRSARPRRRRLTSAPARPMSTRCRRRRCSCGRTGRPATPCCATSRCGTPRATSSSACATMAPCVSRRHSIRRPAACCAGTPTKGSPTTAPGRARRRGAFSGGRSRTCGPARHASATPPSAPPTGGWLTRPPIASPSGTSTIRRSRTRSATRRRPRSSRRAC